MKLTYIDLEIAARRLRKYFRDQAQHGEGCDCECCEAVEFLAAFAESASPLSIGGVKAQTWVAPPGPPLNVRIDNEPPNRPRAC